ncbi:MAG TPA: HIT family protein [Candidatus Cloacimonadota bacterium]|nr:HIT family protein [Candidatus Cloacimonadota bacterium]
MDCIFCQLSEAQIIMENEHFVLIADKFPVTKGHLLVISKRHFRDFFEISPEETLCLRDMVIKAREYLAERLDPEGFNLGMNCGRAAGQSIPHFHLHIIPRSKDRKMNPIRGMREYIKEIL